MGKAARVTIKADGTGPALATLQIAIPDDTLLRNTATLNVRVVRALEVVPEKGAGGGRAVAFTRAVGYLETRLDLDAGAYEVNVPGYGPSSSTNSVWLELDGVRVPDPVHLPVGTLGPSSRDVGMTPALPRLTVGSSGEHVLTMRLRERFGPVVDKLVILRGKDVVAEVECEAMLP